MSLEPCPLGSHLGPKRPLSFPSFVISWQLPSAGHSILHAVTLSRRPHAWDVKKANTTIPWWSQTQGNDLRVTLSDLSLDYWPQREWELLRTELWLRMYLPAELLLIPQNPCQRSSLLLVFSDPPGSLSMGWLLLTRIIAGVYSLQGCKHLEEEDIS